MTDVEIKKDQIFVPHDSKYPHGAVQVVDITKDANEQERIHFCNMGGGFQKSGSKALFLKDFRHVENEERMAMQYHASQFGIDDLYDPPLKGYSTGRKWNGFEAEVCLLFSEVERVMESLGGEDGQMIYDEDQDAFIHTIEVYEDEPPYVYKGKEIIVNGEAKKVYPIGDGWTWDDFGPTDEQKREARKYQQQKFSNDSPSP